MVFHTLYKLTASSLVSALAILTVVNFLPESIFSDFPLEPKPRTVPFLDPLTNWNTALSDNAEYIHLNTIFGPESMALSSNGMLYTGLVDGRLVEINTKAKNKLREVGRMSDSKFCRSMENTAYAHNECGRILQVRLVNDTIYAMDTVKGLQSFDIKTGARKALMPNLDKSITGLFNSFAIDPQNPDIIYFTVSSRKWSLERIVWSIMDSDDTSILVAASLSTSKVVILMDHLILANGIEIDPKRDQLLVAESGLYRVHKIALSASRSSFEAAKSGHTNLVPSELFVPETPGIPDNIHVNADEAYIAVPIIKRNGRQFIDYLDEMPRFRKALGRIIYLAGLGIDYFNNNVWKHPALASLAFDLLSGHINYHIFPTESAVLKVNLDTGRTKLLGSDKFAFISECIDDNQGNLYLGSFRNPFIVKVKL